MKQVLIQKCRQVRLNVYVILNIKGHAGEMKVPQKKAKSKQTSKSEKVKKVKQRNRMR